MLFSKISFSDIYRRYIKLSLRFLVKKKLYTLINIAGMTAALSAVSLISIFLIYEFSTDKHFSQYDKLYRLNRGDNAGLPGPLKDYLESDFSEFESICRLWSTYTAVLRIDEKNFKVDKGFYADTTVFSFFDIDVIRGQQSNFSQPGIIFLSESLAKTIFKEENPIGKTIEFEGKYPLNVKGIYSDIPASSHIDFSYLIPITTMPYMGENAKRQFEQYEQWGCVYYVIYQDKENLSELDSRLNKYIKEIRENDNWEMHIQPFSDIYFNLNIVDDARHGNKNQLFVLITIAIGILLMASINYFNISTASSLSRSKEIAIQKTLGLSRRTIAAQFITETLIIVCISIILGFIMAEILMPYFNNLYKLHLSVGILYSLKHLLWIFIFAILLSLAASFYPAIILSRIQVQEIISRKGSGSKDTRLIRSLFIILQYSISIILIACMFTIKNQIKYMISLDPGFDKDQLVYLEFGDEVAGNFEAFKSGLIAYPSIEGLTETANIPGQIYWNNIVDINGERLIFFDCIADAQFPEVMGIEMVKGEFISPDAPYNQQIVINESAQKLLNLDDPVGYTGIWRTPVVGVIEDFHFQSMHNKIQPLMIRSAPYYYYATIRLKPNTVSESMELIKNEWQEHFPKHDFDYHFFDQEFKALYYPEIKFSKTIFWFSFLAIIITCIGLFGLTSYHFETYKKNAGIKIVFGAKRSELFKSFLKIFLKWQIAGIIIGLVATAFLMKLWLNSFAYHTQIPLCGILASVIIVMMISFITIIYHSIRFSTQKPVEVLRDE